MFLHLSVILSTRGGGVCPSACWDTPPWAGTPLGRPPPGRHPLVRHPPGQTPPGRTPPWADTPQQTPPRQTPHGQTPPPSRRLLLRTVGILLECILVFSYNDKKRMTVVCINESEVITFILTCMN